MPIKKRLIKKPKPIPKKSAHTLKCEELSNRLQEDTDEAVRSVMDEITGVQCSAYVFIELIIRMFDTEIRTLQVNFWAPHLHPTYRVSMKYTDKTQEPLHGYLYPSKFAVKTSTRLMHAVILAYLELSKQLGRFPECDVDKLGSKVKARQAEAKGSAASKTCSKRSLKRKKK